MGMKTATGSDKEKEFEDLLREAKKNTGICDVIEMYKKHVRLSKLNTSFWLNRPSITTSNATG